MLQHDWKTRFEQLFDELKRTKMFDDMLGTVEASPWHREANVKVHTEMVVQQYVDRSPEVWTKQDFLGAVCAAFHDVGKPASRVEKHSESRGTYYAYHGHELRSARMFEDFIMSGEFEYLTAEDVYAGCVIIEHHMPWDYSDDRMQHVAQTVVALDIVEQYIRHLISDQLGRISDDSEAKAERMHAWIAKFRDVVTVVAAREQYVDPTAPMMHVLIGASGTGKSTYVKQVACEASVFSLDALRHQFYDATDYRRAYEASAKDSHFEARANAVFYALLKQRVELFIDNTNCSARRRGSYIKRASKAGYRTIGVYTPIALQTVIDRQRTRTDKTVPEDAVRRQYMTLQVPLYGEFDDVVINVQ